ncbi:MAG: MCE family protein [Betaproteobacteria bacterium]|nr:MAG: MCE family protein [Betaproteobacteria bacterium]
MESRAFALITGLFVIGLSVAILTWANWLARDPVERTPYRVVSSVPVTGLNVQAQVRYRGISVGRVSAIGLDRKDARRILIDIEVDPNIPLTRGTYAQLGMEGITGIAYVHLLDDGKDAARLRGTARAPAEIALRPSFMDSVADGAEGAIRDARELMQNLNTLLTPENRKHLSGTLASLERVAANLEATSARLPGLVTRAESWLGEDQRRLAHATLQQASEAARNLPEITRDAQRLLQDTRILVGQFGQLSVEAQGTVGVVQGETLPRVNAVADSADRAAQRFSGLAHELERRPQSVLFGPAPARPGPGEPGFE